MGVMVPRAGAGASPQSQSRGLRNQKYVHPTHPLSITGICKVYRDVEEHQQKSPRIPTPERASDTPGKGASETACPQGRRAGSVTPALEGGLRPCLRTRAFLLYRRALASFLPHPAARHKGEETNLGVDLIFLTLAPSAPDLPIQI